MRTPSKMTEASPRKKILIVDDEPKLRKLLKDFLEGQGYEVFEAYRGDAAISQAQAHHPDLVVLDVLLPGGLDGVQIYHRLKGKSSTRRSRVLFLTATEPGGSATTPKLPLGERCAVMGKPFRLDHVLQEIQRLLET